MTIMHRMFRGLTGAVTGIALMVAFAPGVQAQASYPDRPIRMIVPFAPGGATDFFARIVQPKMQELLGQPVVVENRAGAAGNVGMEMAASAAPDGYVIFMGDVGTLTINAAIFKDMKVVPTRDLTPVSIIADTPSLLVTGPNFPPNTVAELVSYLKERPGRVSFASQGSGSLNRLVMELFAEKASVKINHVPYKGGSGPAVDRCHGRACPFHVRDHRVDAGACSLQSHEGPGRDDQGEAPVAAKSADPGRVRLPRTRRQLLAGHFRAGRDTTSGGRKAARCHAQSDG